MKVIDLLNKIAKGEEIPSKVIWRGVEFKHIIEEDYEDYINDIDCSLFRHDDDIYKVTNMLNDEVKIIEDNEDLELIPDDELHIIRDYSTNWNCRVLKDKINEIIKDINEIRKNG